MKDLIQVHCRTLVIGNQVIKLVGRVSIYWPTFSGRPWFCNSFDLVYCSEMHDLRWISLSASWDPQPPEVIR